MELILLPGKSKKNEESIKAVAEILGPLFQKYNILEYEQWQTDTDEMDFGNELQRLISLTKDKEYCIFAKSAGALLALKGIYEGEITPKLCIFTGIALRLAKEKEFPIEKWINGYEIPTLIIQKKEDPVGSSNEVVTLVKNAKEQHKTILEIDGDNHDYSDITDLYKTAQSFISTN